LSSAGVTRACAGSARASGRCANARCDLLRRPGVDDDEEALATRAELALAGLL
jgi:hypothetical protein